MYRIAVIDTKIEPKNLRCRKFEYYNVCSETDDLVREEMSHGTMIATVLDHLLEEYELINIQVLSFHKNAKGKAAGDIICLKRALELCLKLDIDIVSLSAVSSILTDSKYLYPITKELAKKTVIVSSLDNDGYVTVPASYPFVVGVQSDREERLPVGETQYIKNHPLGVDAYANCMLDCVRQAHFTPSNSLAVPVVVADICNRMVDLEDVGEIWRRKKRQEWKGRGEAPVVLIHGRVHISAGVCVKVMDEFWERYDVQVTCICTVNTNYDIRIREVTEVSNITDEIAFMNNHYKTDLIVIAVKTLEYEAVSDSIWRDIADIVIEVEEDRIKVVYEQEEIEENTSKITDIIYQILH